VDALNLARGITFAFRCDGDGGMLSLRLAPTDVEDDMRAVRCSIVRSVLAASLGAAVVLASADQAIAQETRADIIRQEQAEKLQTL
jgi:hypothetical protein